MIPNITRGSRMAGLMVYLASTDADKTKNAHTEPHLVAGDAAIMAWYDDGVLDKNDALAYQYGIQGVPTLIIFQKGEVKWRQSGVIPARQLQAALQQYV